MPKTRKQRQALDDTPEDEPQQVKEEDEEEVEQQQDDEEEDDEDDDEDDDDDDDDAEDKKLAAAVAAASLSNKAPDDCMEIIADMIDYKAELMLYDKTMRLEHHASLVYFWNLYPYREYKFGHIYARFKLSQLLATVCAVMPYEAEGEATEQQAASGDNNNNNTTVPPTVKPMKYWSERFYWQNVQENLETCHNIFLRKDTVNLITLGLSHPEICKLEKPNDLRVSRKKIMKLIERKHRILRFAIECQKILAPIRFELEEAVKAYENEKTVETTIEISQEKLNEIGTYISENVESEEVKGFIKKLFEENNDENGNMKLKPIQEVKNVLSEQPFSLEWLQDNTELLVNWWNFHIFQEDPALLKNGYRIEERDVLALIRKPRHKRYQQIQASTSLSSSSSPGRTSDVASASAAAARPRTPGHGRMTRAEIEELRQGRQALKTNHGNDPLESSRKLAKRVARRSREEEDEEEEEEEYNDEEEGNQEISDEEDEYKPPAKRRRRDSSMYEKKKSAQQITFMEDVEAEEEEEQNNAVQLGLTPDRPSPYFPRTYQGPVPDEGVFDKRGLVTKRRRFTDEEKNAIKAGLRKFGWDDPKKWVNIKEEYGELLRNRTGVQLKDCWRTMVKKGEVSEEEFAEITDGDV